jgi:hypothetical protein
MFWIIVFYVHIYLCTRVYNLCESLTMAFWNTGNFGIIQAIRDFLSVEYIWWSDWLEFTIAVAARSMVWPLALLGLWVRIPSGYGRLSLVNVLCCQVKFSASGWSLVQRSPTECGVSNWTWSWSLDNEEAVAHYGLSRHGNILNLNKLV